MPGRCQQSDRSVGPSGTFGQRLRILYRQGQFFPVSFSILTDCAASDFRVRGGRSESRDCGFYEEGGKGMKRNGEKRGKKSVLVPPHFPRVHTPHLIAIIRSRSLSPFFLIPIPATDNERQFYILHTVTCTHANIFIICTLHRGERPKICGEKIKNIYCVFFPSTSALCAL